MLLSYPTVLVCYIITLIVASKVPDNFVKASYNDIGLINRDNSTKVDSINLLKCLSKNNITGSAMVFVSDEGQLSVVVEENDTDNKNSIKKSAALCYRVLGFSLSFSTSYNESAIDDGAQALPLRDAILIENIDLFSSVVRNRRIVSSGLYQSATSSNIVASPSLGPNKYYETETWERLWILYYKSHTK